MPRTVPVGPDAFALVDDRDYPRVACYCWVLVGGMPYRRVRSADGRPTLVSLRRQVMRALPGQYVQPADGNALNCTRENLRILSRSDLNRLARKRRGYTSVWKGVGWAPHAGRWRARLRVGRRMQGLGYFGSEAAAAEAFDVAARAAFGDRIRLNSDPDPRAVALCLRPGPKSRPVAAVTRCRGRRPRPGRGTP